MAKTARKDRRVKWVLLVRKVLQVQTALMAHKALQE